jgi:uncharacterized iron-regulated membrane protein
MSFKRLAGKLHLWLGLTSGLIVLLLGVTGCILAFELEIRNLTEPFKHVPVLNKPYLPPSTLKAIAEKHLHAKKAVAIEYPGKGKAAVAAY